MYTGSENVPTETYMMPGSGVNTQITLVAPPEGRDYMANEAAPEAFFDQALYYPAANYYGGYYCTGLEPQSEWEDHRFFSVDGQELHYSGFQAESYPYVHYPPNYGYAQSSYNPYNPYIPGAVIGVDGPFIGTQQYFTNPSYLPPSSPAGLIPLVLQPGSDVYNNSGGSSVHDSTGQMSSRQGNTDLKYQNQRASANRGAVSQRNTAGIPTSESSCNASSSEGSVNASSSKQSSSHGAMTSGNAAQMTQGKILSGSVKAANHFTDGRFSPVQNPSKLIAPSNNILPNYGSNIHGWATMERPRSQFHGTANNGNGSPDILSEQNRGPRTTRTRGQWTSIDGPQMTDVCATNAQGTIVIQTEQYNKDDFPVDYPYAKFFVIKSYSEDDVHKSIKYNVWSSTPNGNKRLSSAYEDAQRISVGKPTRNCPIFLFFSVNASGQFCGVAEMSGPVDFHKDMDFWQQDKWNGSFPVKWHIVKDVPNTSFRHILLENNENKPVTNSRDTQEITYVPGMNMLNIFKTSPLKTSILDDFMFYEERQKIMQEEKSRFLGRSYTSYLPAVVPMSNGNDTGEQTLSADKLKKEEGKQLDIATDQATKANDKQNIGQPPIAETIPAKDPKTSGNGGPSNEQKSTSKIDASILSVVKEDAKPNGDDKHLLEEDATVASSIEKMNALSIVSEEGEANSHKKTIEESSTSLDVVTVGSMHFKVNGAGEISSKTITIGTISIEPKV